MDKASLHIRLVWVRVVVFCFLVLLARGLYTLAPCCFHPPAFSDAQNELGASVLLMVPSHATEDSKAKVQAHNEDDRSNEHLPSTTSDTLVPVFAFLTVP
jgi:hypothetical protein